MGASFLRGALRVFLVVFTTLVLVLTGVFFFFFQRDLIAALKIASIFSTLVALFMSMHLARELKEELLEITSGTKDKMKSMKWYEDQILHQLRSQRYKELSPELEWRVFEPRLLSQTMGGKVYLKASSFEITLRGPRGFVRIMASLLDLKKIFF